MNDYIRWIFDKNYKALFTFFIIGLLPAWYSVGDPGSDMSKYCIIGVAICLVSIIISWAKGESTIIPWLLCIVAEITFSAIALTHHKSIALSIVFFLISFLAMYILYRDPHRES